MNAQKNEQGVTKAKTQALKNAQAITKAKTSEVVTKAQPVTKAKASEVVTKAQSQKLKLVKPLQKLRQSQNLKLLQSLTTVTKAHAVTKTQNLINRPLQKPESPISGKNTRKYKISNKATYFSNKNTYQRQKGHLLIRTLESIKYPTKPRISPIKTRISRHPRKHRTYVFWVMKILSSFTHGHR